MTRRGLYTNIWTEWLVNHVQVMGVFANITKTCEF